MNNDFAPKHICIIDDDAEYGEFLAVFLRAQGMDVDWFGSGNAFLEAGKMPSYDFFIVDLGLPGIDGVELIMLIRARSQAGVIIISGRMGADAFNAGLAAGADMFLNKPVRFDQVLQAIKTVSLRVSRGDTVAASWDLITSEAELRCSHGQSVKLTSLEMQILQSLAKFRPEGCDRKTLSLEVGIQEGNAERNLDAAIFRLRKKIENTTKRPAPIRTLHGFGYKLIDSVNIR